MLRFNRGTGYSNSILNKNNIRELKPLITISMKANTNEMEYFSQTNRSDRISLVLLDIHMQCYFQITL